MLICRKCGRDIDALGQDNCSSTLGSPLCEDCAGINQFDNSEPNFDYEPNEQEK